MFRLSFQSFFPLISFIFLLAVGLFVFLHNRKGRLNQLFFAISGVFMVWLWGTFMMFVISNDDQWVLFWDRFIYLGVALMPAIEYHFSIVFTKSTVVRYKMLIGAYILSVFFVLLSRTEYFVAGVFHYRWGVHAIAQIGHHFFLGFFFFYIFALLYNFYIQYKNANTEEEQSRLRALIVGFSILNIVGGIGYLPAYKISIFSPISLTAPLVFSVLISYIIIRYRLFDIKLVIKRGSIFTVLVFLVTASYAFISYIISIISQDITGGNSILLTGGLTAILVSVGFQPIRSFLQRTTDRYLFKGTYNVSDLLNEIGTGTSKLFELPELNRFIMQTVMTAFRVNDGAIVLLDRKEKMFRPALTIGNIKTNKLEFEPTHGALDQFFVKTEEVIVHEELQRLLEEGRATPLMKKIVTDFTGSNCSVFVPLYNRDKFFGVVILGNKMSGDAYTVEDINVIDIIRKQISVAIEKAQLYNDLKIMNEGLQESIKEATADLNTSNERLSLHNESLLALQKINSDITSTLDPTALTQTIANSIYEDLKYSGAIIILYDEKHKRTNVEAVTSSPAIDAALKLLPEKLANLHGRFDSEDKSLTVQAIISKQVRTGNHLSDMISPTVPAAICDKMQELVGVKAVVAVPIFMENKVIGTIDFLLPKPAAEIQNFEYDIMQLLAHQTGMVWKNVELYNKIQAVNADLKKANDRLQMLDKAKTEFISIASHQLRTPLSIVKGYISMFLEGNFGKQNVSSKDALGKVYESNERLIHLVDDLLNVSRIESDRLQLVLEAVDVVALMKSVVEEGQPLADRKNLKLTFHHDKKVPLVAMDEEKMRQVFFNLVDNAVKYTPAGKIQASVEVETDNVIVRVCDTGAGIAPEQIGELFHKFVRGKSGDLNVNGTGLGLYVARKIVSAHKGGSIHAESEGEGKGSCFVVTLKAAKGKELTEKRTVLVKESEE